MNAYKRGNLALILTTAALLSYCAPEGVRAGEWTGQDVNLQIATVSLLAIDWGQTRDIASRPDKYHELNPILGTHPTQFEVDRYFATAIVGHTIIAHFLPSKWRTVFQGVAIAIQLPTVINNFGIGLTVAF